MPESERDNAAAPAESSPKSGGPLKRFLSLPNDSTAKTLGVALFLCLVCSIVVSTTATQLKPRQINNQALDIKRNILSVAGLDAAGQDVEQTFARFETRIVDLDRGEFTDAVDAGGYDQRKAARDPAQSAALDPERDIAQIGRRAHYAPVYILPEGERVAKIILPIKGYGLWSTLYGFLCLEGDAETVCGISFYEHSETPGLGGEVDNPRWKAQWNGKRAYDAAGQPRIALAKGAVDPGAADAEYLVDGLAGATLTAVGVSNLVQYWLGDDGFGPFLSSLRSTGGKRGE